MEPAFEEMPMSEIPMFPSQLEAAMQSMESCYMIPMPCMESRSPWHFHGTTFHGTMLFHGRLSAIRGISPTPHGYQFHGTVSSFALSPAQATSEPKTEPSELGKRARTSMSSAQQFATLEAAVAAGIESGSEGLESAGDKWVTPLSPPVEQSQPLLGPPVSQPINIDDSLPFAEKPEEEKEIGSEEEAVLGLATPCEHLLAVLADIEKFCEVQASRCQLPEWRLAYLRKALARPSVDSPSSPGPARAWQPGEALTHILGMPSDAETVPSMFHIAPPCQTFSGARRVPDRDSDLAEGDESPEAREESQDFSGPGTIEYVESSFGPLTMPYEERVPYDGTDSETMKY